MFLDHVSISSIAPFSLPCVLVPCPSVLYTSSHAMSARKRTRDEEDEEELVSLPEEDDGEEEEE